MAMFYLFIFPIEGIHVRLLVLGIRYKACACAFSSFCCYSWAGLLYGPFSSMDPTNQNGKV